MDVLKSGGLVAFATETVYGLGANALNPRAVAKVFEAKRRPYFDPLIVHIADVGAVRELVTEIPPLAQELMEQFWPGPLTLVMPKHDRVPDIVTASLPAVAVRMPDHQLARELIRQSGVPVAAPSANPFGRISPTTADHVLESLGEEIDVVLDGGPCRIGVESTVLQVLPGEQPVLLRPGGLTREAIESAVGPVLLPAGEGSEGGPQVAPGRLLKHYAPRKKLTIVTSWSEVASGSDVGILALSMTSELRERESSFGRVEVLSPQGHLTEAAAAFFAALRRLDDASDIQSIYALPFPQEGLGMALNDRLIRAAAR